MIQLPEGFDSIFRYIVVVSQRAEQLVTGAKPRSDSRHDKATLIALDDVDGGMVDWRILTQEELDAQRQAIVDQLRAEVGVGDNDLPPGAAIPDVLPTARVSRATAVAGGDDLERDDELVRLQKLLGMSGGVETTDDEDDEFDMEDEVDEEAVTIDLDEAADELLENTQDEDEDEEI